MKTPLKVLVAMSLLCSCSNKTDATRTLEDAGYTNIEIEGYGGPFSCGKDDFSTTAFLATNPAGNKNVRGVVCCGMVFKSCTIRH